MIVTFESGRTRRYACAEGESELLPLVRAYTYERANQVVPGKLSESG